MTDAEIIRRLVAARPVTALLTTQGVDALLTVADQAVLTALSEAAQAGVFAHEWHTDELRRAAGLLRSDLAALLWQLQRQEMAADPQGVLITTLAALQRTQNRPETS
ncbi:MAG: hypothetical protein M3Z04_07270 [Chloroflexota bacterium]|nr:hypothetical protein [Chloroflexota bacterium]